jgi:hypothetical protein
MSGEVSPLPVAQKLIKRVLRGVEKVSHRSTYCSVNASFRHDMRPVSFLYAKEAKTKIKQELIFSREQR